MPKKLEYKMDKTPHLMKYREKSRKLIWMDPKTFNDLAVPEITAEGIRKHKISMSKADKYWDIDEETGRGYSKSKLKDILPKLKKGKKMDPLYLDVDIDNCRVTSHEGRHRAWAAQKLGIKKVPVLVFFRKDKDFIEEFYELKDTKKGYKKVPLIPVDKVKCCVNSHCNLKKEISRG